MNTRFIRSALTLIGTIWSMSVTAAIHYVDVNSTNAVVPYTNWATAANIIQDAIDVALPGDEIMVTNGVYQTGARDVSVSGSGTFTHRVALTQPLTLRSVNGADATIIDASKTTRCVYLSAGAKLVGFTLTNGITGNPYNNFQSGGGGAWCETTNSVISDCVVSGNNASYEGGAVYGGSLNNCTIKGNSASLGGGTAFASLKNCIVTGNSAGLGGGTYFGRADNCALRDKTMQGRAAARTTLSSTAAL